MTEPTYNVTFLTGTIELKPIEYRIVQYAEGPRWWRKKRWAIETDYLRWPGFRSEDEAAEMCRLMAH